MKFQNPSLNSVLTGRTDERTSRNQYAPHFFKVGGIIKTSYLRLRVYLQFREPNLAQQAYIMFGTSQLENK